MLEAIKNAELGDDVFGEDPTVNRLQAMSADMMGKESSLLVTSGTQANLVSIMSNTNRGESAILERESHIYYYEAGGISAIAGVMPCPVQGHCGVLYPVDIEPAIRTRGIHYPETTLICLENTHNRAGGTIVQPRQIEDVANLAKDYGLRTYMDGARIFNAAVAPGFGLKEFTRHIDNLMFCLSKGLSCPAGSLVVGDEEFIERARKARKLLGGALRQAGVLAAPGIIALQKMIPRLEEDHKNARILAKGLDQINPILVDLNSVQTNIVIFDIGSLRISSKDFVCGLKDKNILALNTGNTKLRMVTHRGISISDIDKTLLAVEETVRDLR